MPYNTRRKSLSLPSLGIHVPVTHAARAAAAAANRGLPTSTSARAYSPASPRDDMHPQHPQHLLHPLHPSKKFKRAYCDASDSARSSEPLAKRRDSAIKFDITPPPSPLAERESVEMDDGEDGVQTVDLAAIKDEIVEAVVVQLVKTGNRPHLVKELAAVLMQQLRIVQQSANPCAIISSRLATYLKRPCWTTGSSCPLVKELESIHPRRTYFYLNMYPHQPLPDPTQATTLSQLAQTRAVISPSLSSAESGTDDSDERRRELSPSPEVDLSSHEFDDGDDDCSTPRTPIGSFPSRIFALAANRLLPGDSVSRNHRATSPPLETDEKEFTRTADGLQKRKLSEEMLSVAAPTEDSMSMDMDYGARDENAFFLFSNTGFGPIMTSPAMRPSTSLGHAKREAESDTWAKLDCMLEWDRRPENIALEELDGLLNDL